MPEHQLHNPRTIRPPHQVPDGTAVPVCYQCRRPLHEAPLEDITTRAHKRTYCNDQCYAAYIEVEADKAIAATGTAMRVMERARSEGPNPAASYRPPRPVKSATRQVAEAGANIVGYIVWLSLVSVIAVVIAAVFGIDSMR